MLFVATLIAPPQTPVLSADLCREIARLLPLGRFGRWLAPGIAADVAFQMVDLDDPDIDRETERSVVADVERELRALLGARPIDVVLQRDDEHRRKRLLVADMDSTVIEQECIDELADFAGLKDRVAAITERAMRGEIAFEPALRERVALLKGLPVSTIDAVIRTRLTETPGARTLIATMRANGAHTTLVSGGFSAFTRAVAERIGFDEDRANLLDVTVDGHLAGTVREPVLGQDAKRAALHEIAAARGIPLAATLAVGDGANDLAMIRDAGLGVAYRAKPKVAAEADARIAHGDLTALLYAQGFHRDEFVER